MQSLPLATNRHSAGDCATDLLDSVPPVIWFIRRQMRDHRHGLSLPQLRVLAKVHSQPTASLSAVAEHVGASLPTASRLVNGLVAKGLLARAGATRTGGGSR